MANEATVNVQATVLPDEIAKIITGSVTIAPADANDKWYYKKTMIVMNSTSGCKRHLDSAEFASTPSAA